MAEHDAGDSMLVVYLHGMYSPLTVSEELDRQSRLATIARHKGFSVLALHGRQGLCVGAATADFWCWPSNERTAVSGAEVVDGWSKSLTVADMRAGHGKRFLLGFSNGGYFASLIATRSLAPFDGFAVAHAGLVEPIRSLKPMTPWLLLTADADPSVISMMQLDTDLDHAAWPHAIVTRDGGHQLTDGDIEMTLQFFTRLRTDPLPFVPPLSTRRPQPTLTDPPLTDQAPDTDAQPILQVTDTPSP